MKPETFANLVFALLYENRFVKNPLTHFLLSSINYLDFFYHVSLAFKIMEEMESFSFVLYYQILGDKLIF